MKKKQSRNADWMLVVPVFYFACFSLMLLIVGGFIGMALVGRAPVSWESMALTVTGAVMIAVLLFSKASLDKF